MNEVLKGGSGLCIKSTTFFVQSESIKFYGQ